MTLRYIETTGTTAADILSAGCGFVTTGLQGNDTITGVVGDNQLCIGGTGTNTYSLIPAEIMTVLSINGANEVVSAPEINFTGGQTYWGTVGGKSLLVFDNSSSEGVIVVNDERSDAISELFHFGGATYTYSDLMGFAAKGGAGSNVYVGDVSWSGAFLLANGSSVADNLEAWSFYSAKAQADEGMIVGPAASAASIALVQADSQAILRQSISSALANSDALRLDGGLSVAAYVTELISKAAPSTGAALLLYDFIKGITPDSASLDGLATTAANLVQQAGGNPNGSWQQMGASLTDSHFNDAYKSKYAGLAVPDLVNAVYQDVYGSAPSSFSQGYFQNLVAYYKSYFAAFSDQNDPTGLTRAEGTLIGDMLKEAMDISWGKYPAAERAFLTAAANGTATYGQDLLASHAQEAVALVGSDASSSHPQPGFV